MSIRKTKILFYTIGTDIMPSSRARVYIYRDILRSTGIRFTIIPAVNSFFTRMRINGKRDSLLIRLVFTVNAALRLFVFLTRARFYTHIYVQKIIFPSLLLPLVKMITRKRKMFLDIDDAVYQVKESDDFMENHSQKKTFSTNLSLYDTIVFSTELLRNRVCEDFGMPVERTAVMPNFIDTDTFKPAGHGLTSPPVIGWVGTPTNTVYLEPCLRALDELRAEGREFRILLCGADIRTASQWYRGEITTEQWSLEREVEIYDRIDIGIMPLPDDEWSAGKAAFKLMLYMAMGKIAVASDVGQNRNIIEHGTDGFLVADDKEWKGILVNILDAYDSLADMGKRAREKIVAQHSLEGNGQMFVGMFSRQLTS